MLQTTENDVDTNIYIDIVYYNAFALLYKYTEYPVQSISMMFICLKCRFCKNSQYSEWDIDKET